MNNYSEQVRIYLSMYQSAIERNCELQRHLDEKEVELNNALDDLEYLYQSLYQHMPVELRRKYFDKYLDAKSFVKAHRSQDDVNYYTINDDIDNYI